ncbi:DUF2004 domain-containing protein [Mucilaginibacter jinjuensis]|uniref:DUF2004 domain-containing protein n=1 Tax=Mucilaginibacter jinjuensis TaxID=1176721 RepID=A0ABY7T047_9SPHI|nr:DUF2004 domain-containing protein [Mucilaginibacter jinjuensis]WCT09830.1 DUF2004 domain-containing protein [Mucilaginibacter jinjuensis]
MIVNLPFFNEIDSDSLTDYYEVDIDFEQRSIELDINFNEESIEPAKLLILKSYLDDLPGIINVAQTEIDNDFKNGEDVKEFLDFHTEELDKDELENLLKDADKNLSVEQQILSVLKLRRIGFYPDEEDELFAVLDFIIDEDISQYILVVKMNSDKAVDHITMES